MQNKYYESLSDYGKERYEENEKKAKTYFDQKARTKAYHVYGYDSHSDGDIDVDCYLVLTDDEVTALEEHLIQSYNEFEPEDAASSVEEFMQVDDSMLEDFYEMLNNESELWNRLVCNRLESNDMIPTKIDFLDYEDLYHLSCYIYDKEKEQMVGPCGFLCHFTDEEYITLLTLQLDCKRGLTFNSLLVFCPELAKKISDSAEMSFFNPRLLMSLEMSPYVVVLKEIVEDANSILAEDNK